DITYSTRVKFLMPTLTHSSRSDPSLRGILYAAGRATQPKWGKMGEATPRAHLPPFPSRHSAVRVPRNEMSKGAADTWGMAAALPPLGPAAACGRRAKAPTTTTAYGKSRSSVRRKLSVRKRTCATSAKFFTATRLNSLLHRRNRPQHLRELQKIGASFDRRF